MYQIVYFVIQDKRTFLGAEISVYRG